MPLPLRDSDIRLAAYQRLLAPARRCADTLIVDELGLQHGAARIDIAVINGHIRGVEIKAEADNLMRLSRQVAAYGYVVDKATLIAAERHLESAVEGLLSGGCGLIGLIAMPILWRLSG
jgi:hypothetical protein